ncbi:transglycosylase SLT domain-containing protein [Yersinia aldovae]|uniref:Transglycosylase n=1 Tax=Yersinia aldovae TaxID=29483 RepID=A0ABM9SW26_YERAL|nr:transglycosylase SLT domain-containing protein [Yersinia aldovae]CNL42658.1 transglycosylase [Yersinia aldovae]
MASYRILNSILLMLLTYCLPISAKGGQQVSVAYHEIAAEARVPAELLYSLALAESSRRLKSGVHPWPWTINIAGKGYRYNTREEAWQALTRFVHKVPLKRIDVGITQVNLGWNGHLFPSFYDAFDPATNLRVAARILRSCYETSLGSWIKAAGCYHHPAGGKPAANYIAIVRRQLNTLPPSDMVLINNQLSWIEPK